MAAAFDVSNHGRDCGIVEDQGAGEGHTELRLEGVPELDGAEGVQAGGHQRGVGIEVSEPRHRLSCFQDNSKDVHLGGGPHSGMRWEAQVGGWTDQ